MKILNKLKYQIHRAGVSRLFDQIKYRYSILRNFFGNRSFRKDYPDLVLPPDYILYESFGLRYRSYYEGGYRTAQWLVRTWKPYIDLKNVNILDWGCGPARIVRHLPELLPTSTIYGTDYNEQTIKWCQKNIFDVDFSPNNIDPPLPYPDSSFDVVYGISIFTHLSERNHPAWIAELHRVLKPGGILLITTQGKAHSEKLIPHELDQFQAGRLVIRQGTMEGHLTYNAFQPEEYIRGLLPGYFDELDHIRGKSETWGISQDVWCLQRLGGLRPFDACGV